MNVIKKCLAVVASIFMLFGISSQTRAAGDDILQLQLKDGVVAIQLRPDLAPKHVEQIRQLVRDGAYDNVAFHRVIDGFMAQTGDVAFGQVGSNYDASRVGTGGSKYSNIEAEFSNTPFKRGTVGMARSQDPHSANSQFFICFEDAPHLNGQYTIIGEVVNGMEFVDTIKRGSSANNGTLSDPDVIIKASLTASVN